MNTKTSIIGAIALVVFAMVLCGKGVNYLLYTFLGRLVLILSVIGFTIVNKYFGILATILIFSLYNSMDFTEGFTGEERKKGPVAEEINPAFTSSPPGSIQSEPTSTSELDVQPVMPITQPIVTPNISF